ncbi:MAG: beta strand repeat-containing protein [Terriglobales bacterium]
MQSRRLHFALLLIFSWAFSLAGVAQTATYHLHKEASAITAADDKLLTAGPDGTSVALTTALTSKAAGEYLIKEFETQTSDPNTAGVIPSGSTLTFNLFIRKTANTGTVFPRAKIRLNNATGTLFCTATGTTALSTTVKQQAISCTTTANISMAATDRFYLWVGVNLTATSTTTFSGELDIEGTLNGSFDSTVVLPLGSPAPTITSLTPSTGAVASSVVIAGTNFRTPQGSSTVSFNGIASTPTAWSATSITAPVPTGASTGSVLVTVGGQPSNGSTFTVTPAPSIASLAPNSGAIGSVITINGSNFGPTQGNGGVKFGTLAATISSWSATSIVATVPSGAVTGSVVVTAAGGVASNGSTFTVTSAPAITSVAPAAGGGFGSSFTITGTNFGGTQGNGKVTLNSIPATVSSWSATSIVAQVPSSVTTGNVVVTAAGGVSSNGIRFKVLNPGGVAIDQTIFADGTATATTRATATFSTSATNELLLAFISSGKGTAATTTVSSVAGGSLTWVLVQRTNTQQGTAEIWRAFAPTALTNITVTATFSQSVLSSMTVVSFTGVDQSGTNGAGAIGAIATANTATGAPSASLTTTRANSVVFGVGEDPTTKVARTLGSNQALVHQLLCGPSTQTCTLWVQQTPTLVTATGTSVTINDTAPTADAYNLSLVEIRQAAVAPAITSLTPASGPIGTSVTVAGTGFGNTQGTSTVTFGGISATPTNWSNTSIVVPVPSGVALGAIPVVVSVPGAGTSNSFTFTVVSPLAISALISPLPNANGWNNTNVTLSYACSGGVPPVQCPGSQIVTTEGANQVVSASATDANGNHASVAVTLNIDKTNPGITASVTPAAVNGVVTIPAVVSFTCSDALSGTASCPASINVTTAGANEHFNGTATDKAGNSASTTLTLNVQQTALLVSASAAPAANAAGWNNSDVTVSFTCSGGVPPLQCPATQTVSTEGANQSISGTVTDAAAQTASTSLSINLDKTPPTVTAVASPAPDANGIIRAISATVTFTCSDSLSGVALCPSPVTITTAGLQTINGNATDIAGNTATTSIQFNLQPFPPLQVVASVAPAPNAAGWNNSPVTVSFVCTGGAPPVSCPTAQTVSIDGANQVITGTATDSVGSSVSASGTVNLDQTPPLVSITSPTNASVTQSVNVVVAGFSTDALSGLATVTCNNTPATISGGTFSCSVQITQGSISISVQASDVAGNSSTSAVNVSLQGPKLSITTPAPLALFAATGITVTGTVDDPNAVVTVNGVSAASSGGTFTASGVVLREGANSITATGTNAGGAASTASVNVILDTTPPTVRIDSPSDQAVLTSPQIYVTGLVNDVVSGTVNAGQVKVTINGVQATVGNRSFMAEDVLLVPGKNVITAVATDRAGNVNQSQITVTLQDAGTQQRLLSVSGNAQTGPVGSILGQPLSVQAINSLGQAMPNVPVTFTVAKSDGLLTAFPQQGRQITVQTDGNGQASVSMQLGSRVGNGNNQVLVTSPGFVGEVMFCQTSTIGTASQIHVVSGESQTGAPGQPLPEPLVAIVLDAGGNPVAGVPVSFKIEQGGGLLDGAVSTSKVTDDDGRVAAVLSLAQEEGINNNTVLASFDGLTDTPATFVASGTTPKNPANTVVSGIVLDNANQPIPNATASIKGTNLSALTDVNGKFSIPAAPVGAIVLFIDGATSTRPETFPFLEFTMVTVSGQDNHLNGPIFLPPLDMDNSQIVGGDEDVVLTLKGNPGVAYTVFAHSAKFPDGSTTGRLTLSAVHADKVPMALPNGTTPAIVGTLQPARVKFDPPIRIQVPNTSGLLPGQVAEVFSFDHDLEQFVSGGTARVSEDGSVIVSDKGFGLRVSGWHAVPPPPPPPRCVNGCKSDECSTKKCVNGHCQSTPINEGQACGDKQCSESVCQAGKCVQKSKQPNNVNCNDGKACTEHDQCNLTGQCVGEKIPDHIPVETSFSEEFNSENGFKGIGDLLKLVFGESAPEAKLTFAIKEKKTGQCCEKESTEGSPKFEDKVEDSIQGSVGTAFPEIPITPFPEISGVITKIENILHVKIGLFGSGNIEGSLSGSETTQDCDKSVEGEITGGLAVKVEIAGKLDLPAGILTAEVKGEWGLSAKIGGNSSEIGTKIFFNAGTEPLSLGYDFSTAFGILHFSQSFEVLPAIQAPVFCILHPRDTPWSNLTSCP